MPIFGLWGTGPRGRIRLKNHRRVMKLLNRGARALRTVLGRVSDQPREFSSSCEGLGVREGDSSTGRVAMSLFVISDIDLMKKKDLR